MPNDPMNPMDSTINNTASPFEEVVSKKNPKLVLIVIGVLLSGLILWGVTQINTQTERIVTGVETSVITEEPMAGLNREKQIQAQLDALAAEDTENKIEVAPEEIQAQLDALAAEDTENKVEVTPEEIQAQLDALAAESAALEAQ